MTAAPNRPLLERVARAIHEAKIKECWGWMGSTNREPWEKPNAASPSQPWHDIANAQAKAALEACRAEEMRALLDLFCREDPGVASEIDGSVSCFYCQAFTQISEPHEADCPWKLGKALLAKLDGQP